MKYIIIVVVGALVIWGVIAFTANDSDTLVTNSPLASAQITQTQTFTPAPTLPVTTSSPKASPTVTAMPTKSATPVATVRPSPTATPASSETVTLRIKNFAYVPSVLTVKKGTKIEVVNEDAAGHTVTADNGSFDTSILGQNEKKTLTMNTVGTFGIHCLPHPSIKGTIVVTN